MKSRTLNLVVIVAVLVISALVARLYLKPATLQRDLKASLDRFWANRKSEVEVTDAGDVRMRIAIPLDTPQSQREWTFPVSRWVAARHPEVKVLSLTVTDSTRELPLLEPADLDQTQQGAESNSVPSQRRQATGINQPYWRAARAQLLQRQGQSLLDQQLGRGRTLLLADVVVPDSVTSWLPNVPRHYDQFSPRYGIQPREKQRAAVPGRPAPETAAPEKIVLCLVLSQPSDATPAQQVLQKFQKVESTRVVVLPPS